MLSAPMCWPHEGPCACLRLEICGNEALILPYAHLISASLILAENTETLRLSFSSHDVELQGHNLRTLLLALQDFAVKWVRAMPGRYQGLEAGDNGVITASQIAEAN